MPTDGTITVRVSPTKQSATWARPNPLPALTDILLISNADFVEFDIFFENTETTWLGLQGYDGPTGYLSTFSGEEILPLDFRDTADLMPGTYKATISFILTKAVEFQLIKSATVTLLVSGAASTAIQTDQTTYEVVYNRADNSLHGDTAVNILNNNGALLLKFWQNKDLFAPAENFTNAFTLVDNPANPLATNPDVPATGQTTIGAKILKQTGEFLFGFNINLVVVDGGITVQPESLAFEVFKAPGSEKSAVLTVTNPLGIDFEVTAFPSWITLSAESGNTDLNITVTTETSALAVGTYAGTITFAYNNDLLDVPVNLDLKSFIVIDETKDFCLDLPEVLVNRKMDDAKFVRITLSAVYVVLGTEYIFEKTYQSPYFKGVAKFALGEKLHRHFPRAKRHFFDQNAVVFLKNIVASIQVEELNSALEVLFSGSANGIKLFPGKKPAAFPLLSSAVFRKKNGNGIIFSSTVSGEFVDLHKTDENTLPAGVAFYDFPKTYEPVHLQWENQNLCPDWFTLTGEYKITPEFNHIYARNIFNAQNEKYDVSAVKTLTINTGMFLAKERELMSEIIKSKTSFLMIEGKIYRAFNVTKKNVEADSTEELVARDLEFLIVE